MSSIEPVEPVASNDKSSRLDGWPAARAHITLVLGLSLSMVAFVYELARARAGNALSWAYVFEWPLLAGFGIYLWWHVISAPSKRRQPDKAQETVAPEHVEMLAAWNEQQMRLRDANGESSSRIGGP